MTSSGLRRASLFEIAARVAERTGENNWFIVVALPSLVDLAAERLAESISTIEHVEVATMVAPSHVEAIAHEAHRDTILVLSRLDAFTDDDWRHLDLLRSGFGRRAAMVLVMSDDSARRLLLAAPHLASWIAGGAFEADWSHESPTDEAESEHAHDGAPHGC